MHSTRPFPVLQKVGGLTFPTFNPDLSQHLLSGICNQCRIFKPLRITIKHVCNDHPYKHEKWSLTGSHWHRLDCQVKPVLKATWSRTSPTYMDHVSYRWGWPLQTGSTLYRPFPRWKPSLSIFTTKNITRGKKLDGKLYGHTSTVTTIGTVSA